MIDEINLVQVITSDDGGYYVADNETQCQYGGKFETLKEAFLFAANFCPVENIQIVERDAKLYERTKKEVIAKLLQELYGLTFEFRDPYGDSKEEKEVLDREDILAAASRYGVEINESV